MLKNLSLRYDASEDRLLLQVVVVDAEGLETAHALHITRRLCAVWRGDLQAMVDLSSQAPAQLPPVARAAVSKAHHDAQSSQATVRTEPASRSVPADLTPPLLVTRIVCGRHRADGRWVVQFERRDLPSLGLMLNAKTLHALVDALSRRVKTAQWNLPELASERALVLPELPPAGQFH